MTVDDFDLSRSRISPFEANAPLIVDANAPLTTTVTPERFETVAGRATKVNQRSGLVEINQFARRHCLERPPIWRTYREPEETLCFAILKALYHLGNITYVLRIVKTSRDVPAPLTSVKFPDALPEQSGYVPDHPSIPQQLIDARLAARFFVDAFDDDGAVEIGARLAVGQWLASHGT